MLRCACFARCIGDLAVLPGRKLVERPMARYRRRDTFCSGSPIGRPNKRTNSYKEMGVEEKDTNGGTLVTLSGGMADAVERARRAVVKANARRRWPSSGVVSAEGLVLTANHTVERDGDLSVEINEGRTFGGQLAGRDPASDLALLRVEGLGLSDLAERTGGYRRCAHR